METLVLVFGLVVFFKLISEHIGLFSSNSCTNMERQINIINFRFCPRIHRNTEENWQWFWMK